MEPGDRSNSTSGRPTSVRYGRFPRPFPALLHERARRFADVRPEVADEVGLVEIAEIEGEACQIGEARSEPRRGLVQPVTADDPLRREPHVPRESALQGARRAELLDPEDRSISLDPLDQ